MVQLDFWFENSFLQLQLYPCGNLFFLHCSSFLRPVLLLQCNNKLFGTAISEYLIDNYSKVVAAPVNCQLSNGLVELNWKVIVHMAWAYLMEKSMPHTFWFCAFTHAVCMTDPIPGRKNILSPLSYLSMVLATTNEHGSHFLPCAIFIMRMMVIRNVPNTRHIP